jgi:hypothetical protein
MADFFFSSFLTCTWEMYSVLGNYSLLLIKIKHEQSAISPPLKKKSPCWMWWYMCVISMLREWRLGLHSDFKTNLGYIARPCLNNTTQHNTTQHNTTQHTTIKSQCKKSESLWTWSWKIPLGSPLRWDLRAPPAWCPWQWQQQHALQWWRLHQLELILITWGPTVLYFMPCGSLTPHHKPRRESLLPWPFLRRSPGPNLPPQPHLPIAGHTHQLSQ